MRIKFINRSECERLIVSSDASIEDALSKINLNAGLPCLVIDDEGRCLDLLTDGDLRRLMIRKHSISEPLSTVMDGSVEIIVGLSEPAAKKQMESSQIRYLPVADESGVLSGMWALSDAVTQSKVGSVLILAGGEGKRLRPITQTIPKPLVPVGGLALLDRSIDTCVSHGVRDIFVSVNYLADKIAEHLEGLSRNNVNVTVLKEDRPLGTAGPIGLVETPLRDPLMVINGDLLHKVDISQMMDHFFSSDTDFLIGGRLYDLSVPFGVLETDGASVTGITEKPSLSFPVSAGIYVVGEKVRGLIEGPRQLDMPELIHEALQSGFSVDLHMIHEFWLDVGTPEALRIAEDVVNSDEY